MQYDKPTPSSEVLADLRADRSISTNTREAIASILELDTKEAIFAARWDGTSPDFEGPDGLVPDLFIVNSTEGGELDVPSLVENYTSALIFNTNEDITVNLESQFLEPERVIVLGNGDDDLTVGDDADTTVDGRAGNDTIVTAGGDDSVSGGAGDDSVSTGAGNDTIQAGQGDDTVDGGEGYDVVRLQGSQEDYTIEMVDGQMVITNDWVAGSSVTVQNVQLIQFSSGTLALASDEEEATALRLYQGILGEDVDGESAQMWLEAIENGDATIEDMAEAFLDDCDSGLGGSKGDAAFVSMLFENALGRSATAAELEQWTDAIDTSSRAEVAVQIVGTSEAAEHIDGVQVIDGQV